MYYAQFEICYKVCGDLTLSYYKGTLLRSVFGNSLKRVVCAMKGRECKDCFLSTSCVYAYVFETPVPENSGIMRRYEHVPHPFVIESSLDKRLEYKSGTDLHFNLILIGKAIDYLPYFVYTFEEMGEKGLGRNRTKLELKTIRQKRFVLYDGNTKKLKRGIINESLSFGIPRRKIELLRLNFKTPTRIVHQGETLKNPEFVKIIPGLLRRIFLLAHFHCDEKLPIDFNELIDKAQKIKTRLDFFEFHRWGRYSARQKREIPMEGFVGEVIYEGNLNPFYPYLKAGEVLHIGKGTAFGMGKYKMEVL